MARALINVPKTAKRGQIIVFNTPATSAQCGAGYGGATFVKRLIGLPGDRVSERAGGVDVNGEKIFRATLYPAMAANPFLTFFTTAKESGTFAFTWTGDRGFEQTETAKIAVEG